MILSRKGAMGDMLMLTPLVRELRRIYPDDYLGIETLCSNVFLNSPYIDEAKPKINRPKEHRYILDGVYESNFDIHPVDAYARNLGITLKTKKMELFHTESDRCLVNSWWNKTIPNNGKPVVVMHLGLTWVPLQAEQFDKLIDLINHKYNLVLVGQRNHTEYYPKDNSKFFDLTTSKLTIQQLSWLIEKADVYFGTDTGVLHIAGTTSTPICACFSFINPECRKPFREGLPFKWVSATKHCDTPFCAERNKRTSPSGDFAGVKCDRSFACAQGITAEMMSKGIEDSLV